MSDPLTKKQLYDLVWKRPMIEVAKEYGLSDRGLAKLCERNGIPVPPRGYWAKKKAGQKVARPPLLILNPKESHTMLLMKQAVQKSREAQQQPKDSSLPDEIREAIEREFLPQNYIRVTKTLSKPHPLVAHWIQQGEDEAALYRKYGGWRKPEKPTELERRRRRIISTLLKALEARGFKVEADVEYKQFIWIKHQWDQIGFTITERIRQYRRELTEVEKKDRWHANQKWTQVREPTGKLMLRISLESRGSSYSAKDFHETDEEPLENQLNAVTSSIIERIWEVKKHRLDREEEERQHRKKQEEKEHREKLLEKERHRKLALETKAGNWQRANTIREYVAAVVNACENKQLSIEKTQLATWKEWALTHAKELDPICFLFRMLQFLLLILCPCR